MHDAQSAKERRHNMLRAYQVDNEELMAQAETGRPVHALPAGASWGRGDVGRDGWSAIGDF